MPFFAIHFRNWRLNVQFITKIPPNSQPTNINKNRPPFNRIAYTMCANIQIASNCCDLLNILHGTSARMPATMCSFWAYAECSWVVAPIDTVDNRFYFYSFWRVIFPSFASKWHGNTQSFRLWLLRCCLFSAFYIIYYADAVKCGKKQRKRKTHF